MEIINWQSLILFFQTQFNCLFVPRQKHSSLLELTYFIIIVQQSTSKNVKAIKVKKRLRSCHRMEEIKEDAECTVGSCSGSWDRRRTLVEKAVKYKVR